VIAGAMDDGQLNIWDVNAILANTPQTALVTSNATHRGSIKVVEFNPVTPKILMSAGQGGEVARPKTTLFHFQISDALASLISGTWRILLCRFLHRTGRRE
jgi:hypothetical protein